jgi:hypothetical protein
MKYSYEEILRRIYRGIKKVIGEQNVWKIFRLFTNISNFRKMGLFQFRNFASHEECYITCTGKRDGAGAQSLAIMSTILFAEANQIKYLHTPFANIQHNYENDIYWEKKWEDFFNLGMGELRIGNEGLRIVDEISVDEDPFRIKKRANTLFVVRHCHDYADLFPNRYSRIRENFVEKYYASSKSEYELNYYIKKVNVAIHLRRGDVNGSNQFRDKFTDNKYVFRILSNILETIDSNGLVPSLCVYSEGENVDFVELESLNPKLFLNISPFTTFHNLVCADVLMMSKSTFSYSAALLSKGIVFYESFRHKPQHSWIKIKNNSEFNHKEFSRKLQQYIFDHPGEKEKVKIVHAE